MLLKEKIENLITEYLREPEKHKIHRIELSIPGHDGRFWIIDAFSLMVNTEPSKFQLAIYFSVNQHSRKGRRIVQAIEVLDLFADYNKVLDGRCLAFNKVTDNNRSFIADEIINKANALFPTLNNNQIQVNLIRLERAVIE